LPDGKSPDELVLFLALEHETLGGGLDLGQEAIEVVLNR
jgi:hypothetical protein